MEKSNRKKNRGEKIFRPPIIFNPSGRGIISSKELTLTEARLLLSRLNQEDEQVRKMMQAEARTLCRSINYLASQISFLNKDFPTDTEEDREMNKAKLNVWARKYSKFRKNIQQMNVGELREVKKQLEAIARKGNKENKNDQ